MTEITIFTDGAARGNPNGPGGYGSIVRFTDGKGVVHEREYSAGYAVTTNNRMELMAAIVALENLKVPCRVTLYSDSKYLTDAYNEGWIYYWQTHGYRNKGGDAVKNTELWKRLFEQTERHEVTFVWVKGHNGHPENERCDQLATEAADGEQLYVDDGGDLREAVPYVADTDSPEALYERIERLRAEIDEKMALLEKLEEQYYS
ncbi:MAG: ribonuclease HI [Lachnospiraceae bacterium]|nr:ribonuclease HI [Lachnospiraceae bacterium]